MDAQKIPSTCLPLDRSSVGGGNVSHKICTVAGDVCQANLDAPVDATTAESNDDEVIEARTNLTRRDPVHCESKWERFSHRRKKADLSEIYCCFPRDER